MNGLFTVLVVDGNMSRSHDIARGLRRFFGPATRFVLADGVSRAVRHIADRKFSCIIVATDLQGRTANDLLSQIPGEKGQVKSRPLLRDPVVMVSTGADTSMEQHWISSGAHELVCDSGLRGALRKLLPRAVCRATARHQLDQEEYRAISDALLELERVRIAERAARLGIWDWDISRSTVFISDHYRALYGIADGESVSYDRWLNELVHPDDRAGIVEAGRQLFEHNAEYQVEFRVEHPQLGTRWILGQGQLFRDNDGVPIRFTGANIDVTERKRAENALTAAAAEKDAFIAVVAHELRNPLAPLLAAATLCEASGNDAHIVRQCAGIISRQVTQLSRLLDDLIDVARMSHQKLTMQFAPVSLSDVVQMTIEVVQPTIEQTKHELLVDLPTYPVRVNGDAARLMQLAVNLVGNAIKFSHSGARIWLTVERKEQLVELRVRDEGYGVEAKLLPHLFDPFVQGSGTPSTGTRGLGIGLALVKKFAEAHGGTVRAESNRPLPGTTFVVALPGLA